MAKHPGRIEHVLWPAAAAAALGGLWHAAVWLSGTSIFPSPAAVLQGILELARGGHLWRYIADSLLRVVTGFGLAALVGVPAGLVMGSSPAFAAAAAPVVHVLRPISPIAWIPLAIVFFGVGHAPAVFLIFLAALFPIVVSTAEGVRGVSPIFLAGGRNFGLSRPALIARVLLPAALPRMLSGLRLAFGVAWMVLVAAEMIAVDSGLGYLILDARNAGKRYDLVVAGMLLIGLTGLLFDVGFRRIEALRALCWGFRSE